MCISIAKDAARNDQQIIFNGSIYEGCRIAAGGFWKHVEGPTRRHKIKVILQSVDHTIAFTPVHLHQR